MCGITGFTGIRDPELLCAMNESLRHRGPDDDGVFYDGEINMGMRRLSIVDVEGGRQPISNEDNTVNVIFNGEIYDHYELREGLIDKGHVFRTDHSDTETIVHLYEEYEDSWPLHVNGMFAVAVWDSRNATLSLFRDRIGKKPLYYALTGADIVFGSEIKSVLKHPGVSGELDHASLYSYFGTKNISAPDTAYRHIKQLMPGHVLTFRKGAVRTYPYWQVDFSSPADIVSEDEVSDRLLDLLQDAVKIRMRCDVPYGAYLSGGVDSSSVVVLMNRMRERPIITFSLGYEDAAAGQFAGKKDDVEHAREISARLGTEHHEYIINSRQFSEKMTDILRAFDEPFSGTVSTFFLSILIKEHVKVALSGDGADELFGSYLAHRLAFPVENFIRLRAMGKTTLADLDASEKNLIYPFSDPAGFDLLMSIAARELYVWRGKLSVFDHRERAGLLNADYFDTKGFPGTQDIYKNLAPGLTGKDILNRSLEMDQKELLPNQVLPFVDRLSMAHSVEVRCPYLDYRIIEFADKLPGNIKIREGVNKYIHKKAMEKILPESILKRPKEGFVQPVYSWMHSGLREWTLDRLEELPGDLFNKKYVKMLTKRFTEGDTGINAKIWNLVCFSIWFREVRK